MSLFQTYNLLPKFHGQQNQTAWIASLISVQSQENKAILVIASLEAIYEAFNRMAKHTELGNKNLLLHHSKLHICT